MATLLSFPARAPTADRAAANPAGTAEIVILPCIRRERIEAATAFSQHSDDLQTQRHA